MVWAVASAVLELACGEVITPTTSPPSTMGTGRMGKSVRLSASIETAAVMECVECVERRSDGDNGRSLLLGSGGGV